MLRATINHGSMQDLNDLYLFALVVREGSFTSAAKAAGLTTSRLSRRVAELEKRLGVRLLHRTTRKLALTGIGELYYQHCQAMVSEAQAAAEVIEQVQATPRGRVRVTCPVMTAQTSLGSLITDFMLRYPEVRLSLIATDRLVDLIDEGIDVAIRFRAAPMKDSSLVARPLGESCNYLVASPQLLDRHGRPSEPGTLSRLPTLAKSQHVSVYNWTLTRAAGETTVVSHQPILESDDWLVLKEAAIAGLGLVAMPQEFCWEEIRDGRLEIVMPEWTLPSTNVHLLYVSRRGLLPAVRAFIDFAAERLKVACMTRPGANRLVPARGIEPPTY